MPLHRGATLKARIHIASLFSSAHSTNPCGSGGPPAIRRIKEAKRTAVVPTGIHGDSLDSAIK